MTLKDEERKELIKLYMDNAREALHAAGYNKERFSKIAVDRAYYSMFYAAHSSLLAEGIKPKTHEGVNNLFSDAFVKTGKFPKEIFKTMGTLENKSYKAEYDPKTKFPLQEVEKYIKQAEIFVDTVEKMMGDHND